MKVDVEMSGGREVVTTLVVSLVLGLAQIVMPEESEHKRDLLLAWIRHRECRGKVQVPRPARRIITEPVNVIKAGRSFYRCVGIVWPSGVCWSGLL
ncbi:hypothetical protein ACGFZ9_41260, partial [Streptomyces mirabilis]